MVSLYCLKNVTGKKCNRLNSNLHFMVGSNVYQIGVQSVVRLFMGLIASAGCVLVPSFVYIQSRSVRTDTLAGAV